MAIIGEAKEKVLSREKRETPSERYYKRVFLVQSNNSKEDPKTVENAFGVPKRGFHYVTESVTDILTLCYQLHTRQISLSWWEVVAEYSSSETKINAKAIELEIDVPNPTWGTTILREVVTGSNEFVEGQDPSEQIFLSSTGIVNSAKEPYNPPAEIDRAIPTLQFERVEPTFNHKYMLYYVNAVNKSPWYGWDKRTVKCVGIQGKVEYKQIDGRTVKQWRVTYNFHFNKFTWDLFLLNIGTYYFDGGVSTAGSVKKPFAEKGVPRLGLLTSNGDKSTSIATYSRYRVLEELDFNRLMIPMIF